MLHRHNPGVGVGDKRHQISYQPTGTGRDTYIMVDNGGTNIPYRPQGVPETGNYMKLGPPNRTVRPASFGKIQKYTTDGTGRDQYVAYGHGGQVYNIPQSAALSAAFKRTFRDPIPRDSYSFYEIARRRIHSAALSRYQADQSRRLATPKKYQEKYEQTVDRLRRSYYK